jgi:hypothetical protein
MTDDLTRNLRTVGELLDRRGADAMGDTPEDGDHAPVYPLPSLPPAARRRPPAWLGAAAAAVLLLAGVLALANWNRRDIVGVASSPAIAALLPGDLGTWDQVEARDEYSVADQHFINIDMGVYLPSVGGERERAVVVTYIPVSGQSYEMGSDAEIVTGAGLRGQLYERPGTQQILVLDLEVDGEQVGLSLTSGEAVGVDELFELAASIELGAPLADQELPGWDLMATFDAQRGAEVRDVYLSRSIPVTYDNSWVSLSTFTNLGEEAIWTMTEPFRDERVEVRGGRVAWVVVDEYGASAVWEEAAGVIVRMQIGTSNPEDVDLLDELLTAVEGVVAVDRAGWAAFAAEHRLEEPTPGMPTTIQETTATTVFGGSASETSPRTGASSEVEGTLANGGTFQLWVVADTGQVCWVLLGPTSGEGCDDDPATWLGGSRQTEPRILVDARERPVVAYGLLPEDATWFGSEFRLSGAATAGGEASATPLWAAAIPEGALTGTIRFMDDAGQEIERHDLELADRLG